MIGVICGLESEAVLARKIRGARVAVTSARMGRASRAVRELAASGVRQFLSFGIACGIEPHITSGALYVGTGVFCDDNNWMCDAEIVTHLCDLLPTARTGTVWGSNHLVMSMAQKSDLWQQTRCSIGDMESHEVAKTATEIGLPFGILRALADTSTMPLPPAACVPLHDDGRVDVRGVARSIFNHPAQIPSLAVLGFHTSRAMRVLGEAVPALSGRGYDVL